MPIGSASSSHLYKSYAAAASRVRQPAPLGAIAARAWSPTRLCPLRPGTADVLGIPQKALITPSVHAQVHTEGPELNPTQSLNPNLAPFLDVTYLEIILCPETLSKWI